jgi:hypothetical protein
MNEKVDFRSPCGETKIVDGWWNFLCRVGINLCHARWCTNLEHKSENLMRVDITMSSWLNNKQIEFGCFDGDADDLKGFFLLFGFFFCRWEPQKGLASTWIFERSAIYRFTYKCMCVYAVLLGNLFFAVIGLQAYWVRVFILLGPENAKKNCVWDRVRRSSGWEIFEKVAEYHFCLNHPSIK